MLSLFVHRKIILFLIFIIPSFGLAADELIQAAILLDTSSSMDGLIDQAKTQLWKIVNELALAKRQGKRPVIEVALYEYGNDGLPVAGGYMRQVLPLTRDLDKVSESLFSLTTNGGYEYCGTVIQKAMNELSWNRGNDTLKVIFIAGNEEFTQGNVDFRVSCKDAIAKGIIINTIFCGEYGEGERTFWKTGAELADGSYVSINQNAVARAIASPQDDEIISLNNELNTTYIPYGTEGAAGQTRQAEQDKNAAASSPESIVDRSISKSKVQYSNGRWDLVDAVNSGSVNLPSVAPEALPAELKGKSVEEQRAYIAAKTKEREEIQKRIASLEEKRRVYIEIERKKQGEENTLDKAIISAIHEQAVKKNYEFSK
jgi:hypothetical protein